VDKLLNTLNQEVNPQELRPSKYPWLIVVSMCCIMFGVMGSTSSSMPVFTPVIVKALGVPVTAVAFFFSIRTLVMAAFQPVAAKLLQKYDVRLIATLAVIVNQFSMFIMAYYTAIWQWYISAVLGGLSLGVICYIIVPVILGNWFKVRLGTVIGISTAFTGVGGMVLAPITGQIIAASGYQSAYMIISMIGLVFSLPFTLFVLRSRPEDKKTLPYGAGQSDKKATTEVQWGFLFKEALHSPIFYLMLIGGFLTFFAGSFLTEVVNLAVSRGFSIENAAKVSSMMSFGIILGKLFLGFIRDHKGVIATYITGAVLVCAAFLLLVSSNISPNMTYLGGFLFGMCCGWMSVGPPLLARATIGNRDYAPLYAIAMSCGTVVSAIGHPVYARIFDTTGSYSGATLIVIVAALIALVAAIIAVKMSKKHFAGEYHV